MVWATGSFFWHARLPQGDFNMHLKALLRRMLVAAVTVTATAVAGTQASCIGIVTAFDGNREDFAVWHEGERHSLRLLMPLYQGDRLVLKHCDTNGPLSVTIELAEGPKRLDCETDESGKRWGRDTDFDLNSLSKKEPYSLIENLADSLLRSIGSILDDLHEERARTELVALAGRPVAPTSPRLFSAVLARSGSRVSTGHRELFLSWAGGTPPYSVRLSDTRKGGLVAQVAGLQQPRVNLGTMRLNETLYRVEISDAAGQRLARTIDAVAPSSLPRLPGAPAGRPAGARDRELLETLYAAWLLHQDRRGWSLEAYQRVVGSAPDNYPAQLLKGKLESSL
jgi:hypothetical protein